MKLIVGLGNPGRTYAKTRHNLGFMLLDKLAGMYGTDFSGRLFKAFIAETTVRFPSSEGMISEKIVLAKPQTYMNLSGESVCPLINWYKAELDNILVICDDFNLPVGVLRFRAKGSSGGHNGLKSIINLLGTDNFPRLKIGIGNAEYGDAANFVLSGISDRDMEFFSAVIDKGAEGVDTFIKAGIEAAMSNYNKNFLPDEENRES
ncbi:MAG: aminoacyl-tRNA hydrolase [Candidatus Eremiobacterota bacterium]